MVRQAFWPQQWPGALMSTVRTTKLSPQEYLALERQAPYKSEYYNGEVFAFAGATESHNLIVVNVLTLFNLQLKTKPCKVYPSDMRVKVSETGLYTYPDVTVVCGEAQLEDERLDTLLNPTVIVEVLSPSTEKDYRIVKFAHYRRLPSVNAYILIAQDSVRLEQYVRETDGRWLLSDYSDLEVTADIHSIDCKLPLKDVYNKVSM
jgi:Uma2 family endonuclease